jgi:ABC-type uncharacterized transport system substrate-binding protein
MGFILRDNYRGAASYVDRTLRGEKPADLPVQQPVRLQFAVNLETAKALGARQAAREAWRITTTPTVDAAAAK